MLSSATELLEKARAHRCAVGAFHVYNLETCLAIVRAAESEAVGVILQVGVPALKAYGVSQLAGICLTAARESTVPVAVQLDHCSDIKLHRQCLAAGLNTLMADGGHLPLAENVAFTREIVQAARPLGATVEAELGKLTGSEDGASSEYLSQLTDPQVAGQFVRESGCASLAVSIGNVHGLTESPPHLDFERLEQIQQLVDVPLVLHGASGLPDADVLRAIELGVAKVNVNTEVRQAFLDALRISAGDLLEAMAGAARPHNEMVASKIHLFRRTA